MNKKILIAVIAVIVVVVSVVAYFDLIPKPTGGQFSLVFSPAEVTVKLNETKTVTITLTSDGYEGQAKPFITYGSLTGTGLDVSVAVLDNVAWESDSVVNVNFTFRFYEVDTTYLPSSATFSVKWYGNWRARLSSAL